MPRKGGHMGLVTKTKSQRQRKGRRQESRKTREANDRARRQGF